MDVDMSNNTWHAGNINGTVRSLQLFRLDPEEWHVNVQPYSGSPANFAVFTALLKPHDRIMGLDLPSGGHLTHGYYNEYRKVSATSIYFESLPYSVNSQTGYIDYDEMEALALRFKPRILIAGGSAHPRDWDYKRMREIADKIGAILMTDMAHISGLVAADMCHNPFLFSDVVTSTTHKTLRGPRSGIIFCKKALASQVDFAVFPSLQGGPHNHQIGALAVALKEAQSPEFKDYIAQVKRNAFWMGEKLKEKGYKLITDGTDNHLVLVDLKPQKITGSKVEYLLERVGISVNKNTVVGDKSASSPGGLRLGSPAMTSRGLTEEDFETIVSFLDDGIKLALEIQRETQVTKLVDFQRAMKSYDAQLDVLHGRVQDFASRFPFN